MEKNRSVYYMLLAFFLLGIAVFVLLFINGGETRTSEGETNEAVSFVVCSAGNLEDVFFSPTNVNTVRNELKITFRNDKPNKMFYTYNGVYRSDDVARQDDGLLHAKYNAYFGDHNASLFDLSSDFLTTDTKLRIALYMDDMRLLNNVTARLFFVGNEDINSFVEYSRDDAKKYYESKGFQCVIGD